MTLCNYHPSHCSGVEPSCPIRKSGCTANLEQVSFTSTCTVTCKFCGSKNVVKNGVRTGNIQYYLCRACGHAFAGNNALIGMKYPPEQITTAVSNPAILPSIVFLGDIVLKWL